MRAEILCVGTELLIGQTVNTNASWLARECATIGLDVLWVTTVGDNFERLGAALATACERADLVLVSGGLGPTPDDITVEAIARLLGEPLADRPEVRAHIEAIFAQRKRPITASNYKQALFPPSVELIPNPAGTAYGLHARHGRAQIMTFPGVPYELKAMWTAWARPRLLGGGTIRSVLLKFVGIGESALAEQVAAHLAGQNPSVAPYASNGEVHLRVTAKAESPEAAEALMAPVVAELSAIAPYYYGRDDETLPSVVLDLLAARSQTLALAESCTGGLLASRLTDVPGASEVLQGAVVCYTDAVKTGTLGLDPALLTHGAVNEGVARALAERARRLLGADWALGVTGYAGTGPNVPEDEVGLVYFGVAGPDGAPATVDMRRFGAHTPRETIKHWATQHALDRLRQALLAARRST